MFDMSWSELLLIAVVALIAIGPKDLPKVLKTVAQFTRKARSLAREFQSSIEDMAREAELHEVKKELEGTGDLAHEMEQSIDPGGTVARSLERPPEDASGAPVVDPESAPPAAGEGAAATGSVAHEEPPAELPRAHAPEPAISTPKP
jgi:sec-independent protein translocase protein TatB